MALFHSAPMAQHGWIRFGIPVDKSFCMFNVELGLLGKPSEADHVISSVHLADLYDCAFKTTQELVCHLISTDALLAYSAKADHVAIFAPVR